MVSFKIILHFFLMLCEAKKINRHLKVSSILNPLIKDANQPAFDIGYVEQEYVKILAEYMNFTFEVIAPQDALLPGFAINGSWNGMVGQLQRGEVDMAVTLTDDSHEKHSAVDMTFHVQQVGAAIIIPYPRPGYKTYLLGAPFARSVWLCVLTTSLLIVASLWVTSLDTCKLFHMKRNLKSLSLVLRWLFVYIGTFSNQDFYLRTKRNSFRLVFATMLLTTLVLSNLYTSVFTSLLAAPYYKTVADSIEEVAGNENIRVYAYNSSGTTDYIMRAGRSRLKQIADQWRKHSKQLVGPAGMTPSEMAEIVRGNNVFLTTDSVAENFVEYARKKYKQCRITLAREKFYERGQSMNLPKGSYLTPLLNEQILRMKQAGLIERAERQRRFRRTACKLQRKQPDDKQTVRILMEDLGGAFVLLLMGYLVSCIAFTVELLIGHF